VQGGRVKFTAAGSGSRTSPGSASISTTISSARRRALSEVPVPKRDDTAEMRKHVDPNWTRILPRW